MNYGLNQAMNNAQLAQAIRPVEMPLLPQEFDRMHAAVSDLEGQLEWLLQKIQPICQSCPVPGGANGENEMPGQPSEIRQLLINLRSRVDGMTRRISEVKYTIEV